MLGYPDLWASPCYSMSEPGGAAAQPSSMASLFRSHWCATNTTIWPLPLPYPTLSTPSCRPSAAGHNRHNLLGIFKPVSRWGLPARHGATPISGWFIIEITIKIRMMTGGTPMTQVAPPYRHDIATTVGHKQWPMQMDKDNYPTSIIYIYIAIDYMHYCHHLHIYIYIYLYSFHIYIYMI